MIRRADANQREIIQALRDLGASVTVLANVGKGCPDLLVGWRGVNFLLEVKNLQGRGDKLTPAESDWLESWRGQVVVVKSADEALDVLVVGVY